jgi:DNA-directed RNA polymerase specialized sigma24 family protein
MQNKPNRHISHYEGLVRKTAAIVEPWVEDEFDEICNFLREKVWKAIEAFSRKRVVSTAALSQDKQLERFVYACVQNGKKDVLKKKRRGWLYIEDMLAKDASGGDQSQHELHDSFQSRYMVEPDFAAAEPDPLTLPDCLEGPERQVAAMLYEDFKTDEIAAAMGLRRGEVRALLETIKVKLRLAGYAPTAAATVALEPEAEPAVAA